MNTESLDLTILLPAFAAGVLVLATHVPLGRQVLKRGIIFIDLAIAQIAGLGVIAASHLDFAVGGFGVQIAAGAAALSGALLLTWSERHFEEIQESLIGCLFILAATGGILLLTNDPHGGEALKNLLTGQILWVDFASLIPIAILYIGVLMVWFRFRERIGQPGFYILFAVTVTASVQLVGVYLVFASLIIPAIPTRGGPEGHRLFEAYLLGLSGYAIGIVLSALFDLPTGAVVVWSLAALAILRMTIPRKERGPRLRDHGERI